MNWRWSGNGQPEARNCRSNRRQFVCFRAPNYDASTIPATLVRHSDGHAGFSVTARPCTQNLTRSRLPATTALPPTSSPPADNTSVTVSSSRLYNRTFAFAFFSQIGFVLSNTLMAHYARWIDFLGGDVNQVGWIMGAGSIMGLVMRPWMGQWIDRIGARNMWLLGYALFAIGSLLNLVLTDLGPMIYVCRSFLVLGPAIVFSASLAFITHHAPPERRTEAIGSLGVAGFTGMILGPFLGDVILAGERSHASFVLLFTTAAGSLLLPAILLLFIQPLPTEARGASVDIREFVRTLRRYWPGTIFTIQVVFGLCMTVPFIFLTKYIDETGIRIPGVSEVGLFFLCYAGWGLTVRIISRRIPERLGRRKMLLVGTLIMGMGMLLFLVVDAAHPWRLALPALVCGTGHAMVFHTSTSLFIEPFPNESRGAGSALSLMALDVGMIGGAPLMGMIAQRFGYNAMFPTIAVMCFTAATVYAVASIPVWRQRLREA